VTSDNTHSNCSISSSSGSSSSQLERLRMRISSSFSSRAVLHMQFPSQQPVTSHARHAIVCPLDVSSTSSAQLPNSRGCFVGRRPPRVSWRLPVDRRTLIRKPETLAGSQPASFREHRNSALIGRFAIIWPSSRPSSSSSSSSTSGCRRIESVRGSACRFYDIICPEFITLLRAR
jgi:hypothetical protein